MESVEVSAKTVDEAIDIALEDLGLKRSQVDIEVLTPGKPGLFGLGGEQARVRVTALVEPIRRPAEDGEEEPIPEELLGERVEIKDLDAEDHHTNSSKPHGTARRTRRSLADLSVHQRLAPGDRDDGGVALFH